MKKPIRIFLASAILLRLSSCEPILTACAQDSVKVSLTDARLLRESIQSGKECKLSYDSLTKICGEVSLKSQKAVDSCQRVISLQETLLDYKRAENEALKEQGKEYKGLVKERDRKIGFLKIERGGLFIIALVTLAKILVFK